MKSIDAVHNRFIAPLNNKRKGNIGVELEFPLINLDKKPVDKEFALGFMYELLKNGFTVEDNDLDGNPAFVVNCDGDVISYDNSYNNIEFSMNYGNDLIAIKNRFYRLYNFATDYFKRKNHIIAGIGSNLYKQYTEVSHVNHPVYNMVHKFLHTNNCEKTHNYPDFPAYLSSVQTHLDADVNDVPVLADLFAKIDFACGYIFSNSLSFDDTNYLCMRDFLWQNSAFGLLDGHTGLPDSYYVNIYGLLESYLDRYMFCRIRNGKYELIPPVKVREYFESVDSTQKDICEFLSFRNIEVTSRGTVEVRSSCTQPLRDAFAPPAFYLGLSNNLDCVLEITDDFFNIYNLPYNNSELRKFAVKGVVPPELDTSGLKRFILSLTEASKTGLCNRQKGEEVLIDCLFERAKNLTCPALSIRERLGNGEPLEDIIREISRV
ncbi:MAG: hypothetical protein IJC06_02075 [Clostridia bacterium]|nr:hypothetical protein [Clostridia bacterium]